MLGLPIKACPCSVAGSRPRELRCRVERDHAQVVHEFRGCGNRLLMGRPLLPFLNSKGLHQIANGRPLEPTLVLPVYGLPSYFSSSGLGSNVSTCDGAPFMNRKMQCLALVGKCGFFATSGKWVRPEGAVARQKVDQGQAREAAPHAKKSRQCRSAARVSDYCASFHSLRRIGDQTTSYPEQTDDDPWRHRDFPTAHGVLGSSPRVPPAVGGTFRESHCIAVIARSRATLPACVWIASFPIDFAFSQQSFRLPPVTYFVQHFLILSCLKMNKSPSRYRRSPCRPRMHEPQIERGVELPVLRTALGIQAMNVAGNVGNVDQVVYDTSVLMVAEQDITLDKGWGLATKVPNKGVLRLGFVTGGFRT